MDLHVFCLFALLAASLSNAAGSPGSGAAYFVSNIKSLNVGDEVDYEMRTPLQFSSHFMSSIETASDAGSPMPNALLVLLAEPAPVGLIPVAVTGSSESMDVVPLSKDDSVATIKRALELAQTSTVFTSIGDACAGPSLREALLAEAEGHRSLFSEVKMGGLCAQDGTQGGSQTLQSFLQHWASDLAAAPPAHGTALLLFCLPADSTAPLSSGATLLQAYSMLENVTSGFAALLVPETAPAGKATCTRSLLIAHPPPAVNGTCDATCRTKATLLEVLFVAVVMIIALVSGLCCLVDLDSPTRFETPQDSS